MANFIDYGDHGKVTSVEEDDVETVIENILDFVDTRFEILEAENRHGDIRALASEFYEWGAAETGDDIGYLFLPRLNDE
jgi:hypothetical protein